MTVHLIAPECFLTAMPAATRARIECIAAEQLVEARWNELEADLAIGGSLIVIGTDAMPWLRPLWVDAYACPEVAQRSACGEALPGTTVEWRSTACRGLRIRPPKIETYYGRDEVPRADVVPLVEAVDDAEDACAYSSVWVKHYAPSLSAGRFAGSNWYLFAFDRPLEAAGIEDWARLIDALRVRAEAALSSTRVRANWASYRAGEWVSIRLGIVNRSRRVAAARIDLTLLTPAGVPAGTHSIRRCLNGEEQIEAPWEFVRGTEPGLWRVRAELYHEDRFVYGQSRSDAAVLVERSECAFLAVSDDPTGLVRPRIEGRALAIGDHDGFLAGTHYYPSGSWWDWAWRDFRPERAAADLAEMCRHGYTFARVWIDPEQDEEALRGFEAWLHLSGACGIVSIVCVFTQWARRLVYPSGNGTTAFDFAGPADYNVYSVQLIHIDEQRAYLAALARRWADLPNVVWNLSNEAYIVDPDESQIDPAYFGDVEPKHGPLAGPAYFNRWADLMTQTLHAAGATQPVLRGYGFINGGDCYLQNRDGAMLLWHHYMPAEVAGPCLAFASPGVLQKPLLLEEFGIPTFDEEARLERYEGIACWAAAMGAAGACAYEWGVSWLAPEFPYTATPLKDCSLVASPDPRWLDGVVQYAASWPLGSVGLCPWAASFAYGSNVPCTPFAAPAAAALGSVAEFCAGIGPPHGQETVLVVVPMEWRPFAPLRGYERVLDPTMAAIQALAAAHVPFSVVQEDQLPALDAAPAVVLFPPSQAVADDTRVQLARLAGLGAQVYEDLNPNCIELLSRFAMPVDSDQALWCVRRATRHGRLYMLFTPDGPARVRLRDGACDVTVDVARYALVEALDGGGRRVWTGRSSQPKPPDTSA